MIKKLLSLIDKIKRKEIIPVMVISNIILLILISCFLDKNPKIINFLFKKNRLTLWSTFKK